MNYEALGLAHRPTNLDHHHERNIEMTDTSQDHSDYPLTSEQQQILAKILKAATKPKPDPEWEAVSGYKPEPDCDCTNVTILDKQPGGLYRDNFELTICHENVWHDPDCPVVEHRRRGQQNDSTQRCKDQMRKFTRAELLDMIDDLDDRDSERLHR
jgi:hypothetical protein